MPEVSIVIPNYNHAEFLQQRLASVFNQTYSDYEVILLDDASTDGSADLIKMHANHPKVSHILLNDVNSGSPFRQWQRGIDLAAGEFIWIAESDDYCEPNFLETCLDVLTEDVGFAYVQSIDVNENGEQLFNRLGYTECFEPNIWKTSFIKLGLDFIAQYLLVKNVIPNASAVVFRKDLVKPNYFSHQLLNMRMCGDWLFWIQLVSETQVAFIHKALNYFRHHNQVSRNHDDIAKKKQRLLEEFIIRSYLDEQSTIQSSRFYNTLFDAWFALHTKKDLLNGDFYNPCETVNCRIVLALKFIRFKLKTRN